MLGWDDFLIATKIQTDTVPSGLVNGPYGVCFLEYYKFRNGSSDLIYDHLRNKMNRMTRLFNESSDYSFNLGFGLIGFLWSMKCIIPDLETYNRIIVKDALIPVINTECARMIEDHNFNLFTGAQGVLMFLISINSVSAELYDTYLNGIHDYLAENDILSSNNSAGPNSESDEDFGLETWEGLTGIVLMLSRLYHFRPTTRARKLLQKIIPFLHQRDQYRLNKEMRIHSLNDCEQSISKGYQKLGRSYCIFRAGEILENPAFTQMGMSILEQVDGNQADIANDLITCTRIAYLYHQFWEKTGIRHLKEIRNIWMKKMKALWINPAEENAISYERDQSYLYPLSLTHGIASSRLAYLTMEGKVGDHWDEWMLL